MLPLPPEELCDYSAKIGSSSRLVQGPGGNTSCKEGSNVWVKASGKWLAEAENENIFCLVSPPEPKIDLTPGSILRPSIEAYFHTLLPMKAIFHVHSLGSLTWAIRSDGQAVLQKYFPELLWVAYQKPGRELAEALAELYHDNNSVGAILQNHGMVIWGDSLKQCYERLLDYEGRLLYLAKSVRADNDTYSTNLDDLNDGPYFTPDHAVFSTPGSDTQKDWERQVLEVIAEAIDLIPVTTTLSSLSPESVKELINWEAEIFRRQTNA
jgi:ribulose-5-phosphate 4-epimerase/fuculose-1-phosphate aldolase